MSKVNLTKKEKLTFYGLLKYPTMNDRELASTIHQKMSTVTAIRRRLRERGYYFTVRVPTMQYLGSEIIRIAFGSFAVNLNPQMRKAANSFLLEDLDETYYAVSNNHSSISLSIMPNFSSAKRDVDNFEIFCAKHNMIEGSNFTYRYFPFEITKLHNNFKFAPLLKRLFGIDMEENYEAEPLIIPERIPMNNLEKMVYYGLVKYPELPDNKIAEKVNVSRQAVAKIRKKFENKGMLQIINIPNLTMLGFELLVFRHLIFKPQVNAQVKEHALHVVQRETPNIFMASSASETLTLSVYEDYNQFDDQMEKINSFFKMHNMLVETPATMIFPLKDLKLFRNHEYTSLVKKTLAIERNID